MDFSRLQLRRRKQGQQGFALVLVLAIMVLLAGITLAFFSLASQQRTIASRSAAQTKVNLLTGSALETILGDLHLEITAGSQELTPTQTIANGEDIFRPILVPHADSTRFTLAPSVTPQANGAGGVRNLLKVSKSGLPFHTLRSGYRALPDSGANGRARASAISTSTPALSGTRFLPRRWLKPKLMTAAEETAFVATGAANVPDWIYLNRAGGNPTAFTTSDRARLSNAEVGNPDYVIGRFAYLIYDVGGLIDINLAGNALTADSNARRGRLHQLNPDATIPGVDTTTFSNFIRNWRSPSTSANETYLNEPQQDFLEVSPGDQAFINRQDFLAYATSGTSALAPEALPYFTINNRDKNAPHFEPNPDRPVATPGAGEPTPSQMNPNLLLARFTTSATLTRGADPDVTVRAGTPVMPRRFPLSKLALLSEANPNANSLLYFFGLTRRGDGIWEYSAHRNGRIMRLDEVAAENREPNFFEVLQAFISTDSLGKSGGNSMSRDDAKDSLRNLQVLRIGANIIDQWDGDNIPTTLFYPSGIPGEFLELYGTENLPYINQLTITAYRPPHARNRIQMWGLFDVWNPHQNASQIPGDIQEFRIIPLAGQARLTARYALQYGSFSFDEVSQFYENAGGTLVESSFGNIVSLNANRSLTFPSNQTFPEPTTVGGAAPTSESDTPGVLLVDVNMDFAPDGSARANPAVPEKSQRTAALQTKLNAVMDAGAPYTANQSYSTTALGDRLHPAGTAITGLNTTFWSCSPALPGSGATSAPTTIYAKFGVKAHSALQFFPSSIDPLSFALQAKVNNQWRTIQKVEDVYRRGSVGLHMREWRSNPTRMMENTHHSKSDATLTDCYYVWRSNGSTDSGGATGESLIRFDPRSSRFGLSTTAKNGSGFSLRTANTAWDYQELWSTSGLPKPDRWMVTRGRFRAGANDDENSSGSFGFNFWFPGSNPVYSAPGGVITNNPDALNASHPMRYSDRDGVIRPGDGIFGATPTLSGQTASRPIILNRPFRSVGELGHVFRDLPWKTLDFSTRHSADLGLLDAFSVDESTEAEALVAGKINLNSAGKEVLTAMLKDTSLRLGDISPSVSAATMTSTSAAAIADAILLARQTGPFHHVSDIVPRVLNKSGPDVLAGTTVKAEREAAVRTLASLGTTRTWNLFIDLVVQSGRFSPSAPSGGDFAVQGQQRTWIHLAVDRFTGKVLSVDKEVVDE